MPARRHIAYLVLVAGLWATAAAAEKLDKESKKFLEEVAPIILPDEEKAFRALKQKADREEFQKIFWARRDPDIETAENEYKSEYEEARAEADRRFRVPGPPGSATDCGRTFILLGEPDEVKQDLDAERSGPRTAELWTFRDNAKRTFVGGEAQVALDAECRFPRGSRLDDQLLRVAESRIAHPNIGYRFGKDGRLVKLADQLPKPTPAQALLAEPRQDFPSQTQAGFLKTQDGGTVVVGLVKGVAEGIGTEEQAGRKRAKLVICARAVAADGKVAAFAEQETSVDVGADGSFVAAYRMAVKPGAYTLWGGAVDPKSKAGSLTSVSVDVPDLNRAELSLASLFLVREVEEGVTNEPDHPFAAFVFGTNRLIPRFGDVVPAGEPLYFFYQFYDSKLDEASGKRNAVASLSVFKGEQRVASAADDVFDGPVGANLIGPVALSKYGPGKYKVQLKVKDTVAQKEYQREVVFEVRAAEEPPAPPGS